MQELGKVRVVAEKGKEIVIFAYLLKEKPTLLINGKLLRKN
ncbi:hypothetical protein ACF3DV_03950 [Chlorogloeopsis fritschii PCC 9212]|nr:hypothetical protein [Chlorogloeopsis fritschii]